MLKNNNGKQEDERTLFEKSNFCPKVQFFQNPNIFTKFSPKFFLTILLVKSKLSTVKKIQNHNIFTSFSSKKIDNFLGKSKLNFWTKNEDFKQCVSAIKCYFSWIFRCLRTSNFGFFCTSGEEKKSFLNSRKSYLGFTPTDNRVSM